MSESLYWTWLSQKLGAASPWLKQLLSLYASPKDIYEARQSEIMTLPKIPEAVKSRLCDKSLGRAEKILSDCEKLKIGIMTYDDQRYPRILKGTDKPPAELYFLGQPVDFDLRLCVGVVGTRKMSSYGRDAAYRFSYDIASAGGIIVSGMALGIDGMAAAGALDAGAPTVAVFGSGLDIIYPRAHSKLFKAILEDGFAISEYPPGAEPDAYHFPQRNRIISGISRCVLAVECPASSGTLITAHAAMAQGRPLFAIPGAIDMPGSVGVNNLIKEGAIMVTEPCEIIGAFAKAELAGLDIHAIGAKKYNAGKAQSRYGVESKNSDSKWIHTLKRVSQSGSRSEADNTEAGISALSESENASELAFVELSEAEKGVFALIPEEGKVSVDFIAQNSTLKLPDILMHLMSLTCKGVIKELPGNYFARIQSRTDI